MKSKIENAEFGRPKDRGEPSAFMIVEQMDLLFILYSCALISQVAEWRFGA